MSLTIMAPTASPAPNSPLAAYVHIPFCRRRCFYCDFPISVVGDAAAGRRDESTKLNDYVVALQREIRQTPRSHPQPLQTLFFGGGTPSLMSAGQLGQIIQAIEQQFGLVPDAEISMEIDPGTFALGDLQAYQAIGLNRFSLGVQAFQAELLQQCGRAHTVDDVENALGMLRSVGIENYSIDLISGLPGQTIEDWTYSLAQAIAHNPAHISTYDLTIESGTVFGKRYRPGEGPLPSDEATAQMYRLAHQILTAAGYEHYEISNYAKPGFQCRHNRHYWENCAFYGFGMGATSYLKGHRFARPRQLQAYYDWLEQLPQVLENSEQPDEVEILLDTLMVGLRLAEGISIPQLATQFSGELLIQVWDCLKPYIKQGWVEAIDIQGNRGEMIVFEQLQQVRLTMPEGFLFSNVVLVRLFDRLGSS